MIWFLGKRVLAGIVTLYVLATLVFILARLIGNPVDMLLPPDATPADRDLMIHSLGLDQPMYVQYVQFLVSLLKGDLGQSIKYQAPVVQLYFERLPNTLSLALVAIVVSVVVGFSLGMIAAVFRGSFLDRLSRLLSVIGMSAPSFWVGILLIIVFAVHLGVVPVARMGGPTSYILPGITWGLFLLAGIARLVRSSMIEVLDTEYVKLARIKGVSPFAIVWKHSLRNALLSVVTFIGTQIAFLISGSVAVESVFAWPGIGRLMYDGIVGRDYPLVQGCLLITGFLVIAINLAVDVVYAYIDPRIRVIEGT